MKDLIAKIEAAPEGSRELDIEVAWASGWDKKGNVGQMWRDVERTPSRDAQSADRWGVPRFSTSRDDAASLMPEEWEMLCAAFYGDYIRVSVIDRKPTVVIGKAETEPLARVAAALRAMEVENEN